MLRHTIALTAIFLSSGLSGLLADSPQAAPPAEGYPVIPLGALDRYQITEVEETLETMQITRLRLDGRRSFLMDVIAEHIPTATAGKSSARLEHRKAPQFAIEILVFPARSFKHPLNDDSLNLYLEGLRLRHTPEQSFTILEKSEFTESGAAKFRILGQRAMTIRYSALVDEQRLVYAENWIERDGSIYIVRVQAPERTFAIQFDDARGAFNSISEVR